MPIRQPVLEIPENMVPPMYLADARNVDTDFLQSVAEDFPMLFEPAYLSKFSLPMVVGNTLTSS